MRNNYLTLVLFLIGTLSSNAQIEQVSLGPGYAQTVFYTLSTDTSISYAHTDWDIAFAVTNREASVFVNEAVASSRSAPLPEVELYLATAADFASVDTTGMTRIYNPEISWAAGAFNIVNDESNPFDLGWGLYNSTSNTVNTLRYFVLKLRSGVYKKLEIQSLAGGVYTFRHADMDGSNEVSQTVDKANYPGKSLAYYSVEQDTLMDLEPAKWDMMFTRYYTPLDDGNGGLLDYMVTGVLTNVGVEVAQADGIDPMNVNYMDYDTSYSSMLTTIGHDWKEFDLNSFQWTLPSDRVYFVKNADNELYKIQFLDFEGSSTGIATFEQTFETNVTSIEEEFSYLDSYAIYPNPASDQLNIAFELNQSIREGNIEIYNQLGQVVFSQNINIQAGLNVKTLALNLDAGIYHVALKVKGDLITKTLMVK